MKTFFLAILFLFSTEFYFAGCGRPCLITDNGVYFGAWGWKNNGWDTVFVNPADSFSIKTNGGSCCGLREVVISLDEVTIHKCKDRYCDFRLPSKPGLYKIYAVNSNGYESYWRIVLLRKPQLSDVVFVHENLNVMVPDIYPESLVYPNPAQDQITFYNQSEEIKSISFYNSVGQLLSTHSFNLNKVTIPLYDFPRGVYFVQIATLTDKIILKKIVLQ